MLLAKAGWEPGEGGWRSPTTESEAATPLVLIHGLGGSRRIWEPVIDRLAAERDVIAVDLPGFGGSPELPAGVAPTPGTLAAAVAGLCAELRLERPHVAGNSLGGWVALELAKAGGAATVCAISPAGLWRRPLGPRRRRRPRARPCRLRARPRAHRHAPRARRAPAQHRRPPGAPPASRRPRADRRLARRARLRRRRTIEMRALVFEHPELVTVPTTIAWGSDDRLVRPAAARADAAGNALRRARGRSGTRRPGTIRRGSAELLLEASSAAQVGSGRSSPGQAPVAL